MNPEMEVTIKAYQVIEKFVKPSGNSGRVYVPKEWVGKRVKVFLLESLKDTEQNQE
jgi:putative transposon-encoded protein